MASVSGVSKSRGTYVAGLPCVESVRDRQHTAPRQNPGHGWQPPMQFLRGLSAFRLDIPAPSVTHRVHRFRGAVPSLPCDAAAASGPAEPKAARLHRIRTLHPMKNLLAGALALLGFLFLPAAARAGTFSTGAWTNDATTGISTGKTSWAFHFGTASPASPPPAPRLIRHRSSTSRAPRASSLPIRTTSPARAAAPSSLTTSSMAALRAPSP